MNAIVITAILLARGHAGTWPVQSYNVTVGPAVLTLPQLAQHLSTPDRKVECPRIFQNRALFVRLNDRPWRQTVEVLDDALDVRILPDGEGKWTISADPAVRDRERRWIDRWTANTTLEVADKVQEITPFLERDYKEVEARYEGAISEYVQLKNTGQVDTPRAKDLIRLIGTLRRVVIRGQWLTAGFFRTGVLPANAVREACLHGSFVVSGPTAALIGDAGWLEDMQPGMDRTVATVEFDPLRVQINCGTLIFGPTERIIELDGPTSNYGGDVYGFFTGVGRTPGSALRPRAGPDAAAWMMAGRSATQAYLKTESAQRQFAIANPAHATSISQVIESWSAKTGGEALMELWPLREEIDLPNLTPRSFETVALRTSLADLFLEPDSWHPIMGKVADLFPDLRPTHTWNLKELNGVLLVKNRMAFLDHLREFPLPPFLNLEKSATEARNRRPSFHSVTDYCHATTSQQSACWRALGDDARYRGIAVKSFAFAHPAVTLWEGISDAERKEWLVNVGQPGSGVIRFPLSRLGNVTLSRFARDLAGRGLALPNSLHPRFLETLRTSTLLVQMSTSEGSLAHADLSAWVRGLEPNRSHDDPSIFLSDIPLTRADEGVKR